jgi:choline dehydrogenase-like flavoprotein
MAEDDRFDIVIVGTGPAGMAVARQLADTNRRIALVEGGDEKQHAREEAQCLAATHKAPAAHPDAHLFRRRMLGGASTVWGGRCIPYDRVDYAALPSRPGWPLAQAEVDRWIASAMDFLDAGEPVFDEAAFPAPDWRSVADSGLALDTLERFSADRPVAQAAAMEARANISVLRNSIATRILFDPAAGRATGLVLADRRDGATRTIGCGTW